MSLESPEVLISEEVVRQRVADLAEEISADYADGGEVIMVGVLKGAFIFLADLARRLSIPRRIEFMAVSSYAHGDVSDGTVRMVMDLRESIAGKHVLIVEDIVDTGRTLDYLIAALGARHPASVRTCALLRKKARHEVDVEVDYLGFDIDDVWVVGYGLDFAEQHRTLPYIGVVPPQAS